MSPAISCSIALGYFPRLLGVIYLLAFGSLLLQVRGLYGSQGILPLADHVELLRMHLGRAGFCRYPSVFWFKTSDPFISGCAGLGVVLSLYLAAGLPPLVALILLWVLYLSFTTLGQEFLSYQWDALLLETGFMTIFLPLAPPSLPVCLAYQLFFFRFMFSAGVVKLTSGDPNWRNLRAMCFHYETQPIPNRVAWYAHQLPEWAQKFSTLGTFFFEILVPFLALGPAPLRLACFCLLLFFQGLIILSGSYGFFNFLAIVLAVPLLDDRFLGLLFPAALQAVPQAGAPVMTVLAGVVFSLFILLNLLHLVRLFARPRWLNMILSFCGPWRLCSPYGLFAVMTTERLEFVIEGSNDLKSWQVYEFRWKPGDPQVAPRQAAPHQPRLDWQMWFAALNPTHMEAWLGQLVQRLLEGSPAVLSLFAKAPFGTVAPAYIRLRLYRYHFSDLKTKQASGRWWERNEIGMSAPMSLK